MAVLPLWCSSWKCERCSRRMTALWAQRVAAAKPERMLTFTWCGGTRGEIRLGLQQVIRDLRKKGFKIEYWGVVELHKKGDPHMHLLQRGSYIPIKALQYWCKVHGWGFTHIDKIDSTWSATWYCSKHLCHSHGRRWDGRLIRYSRGFFPETRVEARKRRGGDEYEWEVVFGRADDIALGFRERGVDAESGDLGLDYIMGEVEPSEATEVRYARDVGKGYVRERDFVDSASRGRISWSELVSEYKKRMEKEGCLMQ